MSANQAKISVFFSFFSAKTVGLEGHKIKKKFGGFELNHRGFVSGDVRRLETEEIFGLNT